MREGWLTLEWYAQGIHVPDVYARSGDAEGILDGWFDDHETEIAWNLLDWRECDIPVSAFGFSYDNIEDWCRHLRHERLEDEMQRMALIRSWVAEAGGIFPALTQSPLLVTIRNGRPKIEDGYHRLGIAVLEQGVSHVRSLCASVDAAPPQAIIRKALMTPRRSSGLSL